MGDNVEIKKDEFSNNYVITKVLPRKNELIRPKVTNIDQLLIVVSPVPKPDLMLVDKLIINCFINNIEPILVINKSDITSSQQIKDLKEQFEQVVKKIIVVSALKQNNIQELKSVLQNKTSVFAGQSAVGKSSLLNAIDPQINQATNILSKKVERGKHTTRECTIFVLENNILIADTPGFSMLELNFKFPDLPYYYPEFENYKCKFNNCTHTTEVGCEVINAVNNGKINLERYNRYAQLLKQLKQKWDKVYD